MRPKLKVLLVGSAFAFIAPIALVAQQAGSDWTRVQHLDAGTPLRISSQRRPTVCSFVAADDASLTCTQVHSFFFLPIRQKLLFTRQEITTIKLSRQALSTLVGAAIGTGAGAGIGAAIDASARNQVEEGHIVTVLGALFGLAVGSGVGSKLDFLAGPTIYRAP
jgi:hypothetical protein